MSSLPERQHIELLQGGRAYFPALIQAIDAATVCVQFETYIFDVYGAGASVANALVRAAQRGVDVRVLVDGVGTQAMPALWQQKMQSAGVQWCVYSPLVAGLGSFALFMPRHWRRLHRKLCVVDRQVAFCGGINVLDDWYDPNHGALHAPRFDFAVAITGPLVASTANAMALVWWRAQAGHSARQHRLGDAWKKFKAASHAGRANAANAAPAPGAVPVAKVALVLRDNAKNRGNIENAYLKAIRQARVDIVIANAYFIPGGKLRRALKNAALRGVKVTLLLQGKYEYFMQYHAVRPVYDALLSAGIEIHEYEASFLHAKVAVIDSFWATVGSSNLDPLSLLLAREANVVVQDAVFAAHLHQQLRTAIDHNGVRIDPASHANRPLGQRLLGHFAYALMRFGLWIVGKRY